MHVAEGADATVVIGLGRLRDGDDAIGLAVVDALRLLGAGTRLGITPAEPTRLCDMWDGADLAVVVGAAAGPSRRPGRVHRRNLNHPSATGSRGSSVYSRCLDEAVALSRALDRLPGTVLLYLVEPARVAGVGLSAAVGAAVEPLAEEIADVLGYRIPRLTTVRMSQRLRYFGPDPGQR